MTLARRQMIGRTRYRSCTTCEFGYCAPLRCYCGHKECDASASYIKQAPPKRIAIAPAANPHAESWANREDATWLDKL